MQAVILATRWMVEKGFDDFVVESDCSLALEYFAGKETRKWGRPIQETLQMSNRKHLSFVHSVRETNWVAHYIAAAQVKETEIFGSPGDLPIHAKRAYWMDFFGIPSFRF
ncbi:unnamed protein product [Cuscuta epithymum]|nr:unnamed protein product [Cuscuta epithymum]